MSLDRKADILEAFMHLVSRYGVDKTTMQDIAKEVGISVGVIYKDFKNKEDLIEEYMHRMQQRFVVSCGRILETKLAPEELLHEFMVGLFRTMSDQMTEDHGFFQFIHDQDAFKYLRQNIHKKDEFLQAIEKMLERIMIQGVQEGVFEIADPARTAHLFFIAFGDYAKMIFIGQSQEQVLIGVEEMFSFIIRAIRKTK